MSPQLPASTETERCTEHTRWSSAVVFPLCSSAVFWTSEANSVIPFSPWLGLNQICVYQALEQCAATSLPFISLPHSVIANIHLAQISTNLLVPRLIVLRG